MQGNSSPEIGASPAPHQASHAAAALASLETVRHDLIVTHDAVLALSSETERLRREHDLSAASSTKLQHELETLRTAYEQGLAEQKLLQSENARLEAANRQAQEEIARVNAQIADSARETSKAQTELESASVQLQTAREQLHHAHAKVEDVQETLDDKHAELERVEEHNRALNGELLSLYHDLRAKDLPSLILQLALRLTGAEAGIFTEADGDDTLADFGLESLPREVIEGLYTFSRRVAAEQEPFIENDSTKLPDGSGCVNLAVLPVTAKGESRGVLLLANKRSGGFNEDDTKLLLAIGQHAGLAIENARLHSQVSEAYAATVAVLADAIEAKDAYTRGHCEGVSRVAVEVGRRLGLEPDKLDEVRYAALLHDIGKIGVPDGILLKPGRLMPEEFAIIQKHARIGRDLVSRVPALAHLGEVVLHHHERWDGSGYPDGLAGEGIPLLARVICVVDAFDAMTTSRPYRESVDVAEAILEMQRCSGTQFDPQIVTLIAQVLTELPFLPQSAEPTESALNTPLSALLSGENGDDDGDGIPNAPGAYGTQNLDSHGSLANSQTAPS